MKFEEIPNSPETQDRQFNIPNEFLNDPILKEELSIIDKDPDLVSLYKEIIENNNFEKLREKSLQQVELLYKRFLCSEEMSEQELLARENKLKLFTEFVDNLTPIRADDNDYDEYRSPELSGVAKSYGSQDVLIHSEKFVYGSFREIGHLMSQGQNQKVLDVEDISPRAQIVMNDIANVIPRTPAGKSFIEKYLQNLFDFENGKKVLALYLASVFETPQQALDMLQGAGGTPHQAQRWEDFLVYQTKNIQAETTEEYLIKKQEDQENSTLFINRMKSILEDTGIEPPLSIEIRIKDTAKVI